jgi:5-methylcytosine-specific restriction endonuclease McrA
VPKRVPTFRNRALPGTSRHRDYNRNRRDPALLDLYGRAPWKRFREWVRRTRVLCERCRAEGRLVEGTEVHHKVDPRDDTSLTYAPENVELLCVSCHSRITASRKRA